jgi:palmitoyltransferase
VLHKSCSLNYTNIIKCIIIETKNILSPEIYKNFLNSKTKKEGFTPLHFLSYNGNIPLIKLIIENGAQVNFLSNTNLNLVHMSAKGNQTSSLIYFKEKYFQNIESRDINESTPLHLACEKGSENVVNFLLSFNIDINCQDKFGRTPLFICVVFNQKNILKKLIQKNADFNIKDFNEKLSPKDKVFQSYNKELINIFRKRNLCEILFFRPEIKENKFNKWNMILFLLLFLILSFNSIFCILIQVNNFYYHIFYFLLMIVLFGFYLILYFSNPGKIEKKHKMSFLDLIEKGENLNYYCPYCLIKQNFKIKHCLICKICVDRFDHHCFWLDNCIGKENYNLFVAFLFYINLYILFNFGVSIHGKKFFFIF